VDWLTVTAKRGDDADALHAAADGLLQQSICGGNYLNLFKSKGYHGKKAGGVSVGRRHDGSILTLTSSEAARSAMPFLDGRFHVTRLDLQITCADSLYNASRAEVAYHLMQEGTKRAGRPVSASLRLNSSGGQTLYLGSAKSDVLARLYDKGIEAKVAPAGACWRYEVQYRREPATRTGNQLHQSEAAHDCIAALVAAHFSHRGVVVPEVERDRASSGVQDERLYLSKPESDCDRQLRWLGTYVASTVRKLIDSGKRREVMKALGLIDEK
jgi:DNA relaxase NicK